MALENFRFSVTIYRPVPPFLLLKNSLKCSRGATWLMINSQLNWELNPLCTAIYSVRELYHFAEHIYSYSDMEMYIRKIDDIGYRMYIYLLKLFFCAREREQEKRKMSVLWKQLKIMLSVVLIFYGWMVRGMR